MDGWVPLREILLLTLSHQSPWNHPSCPQRYSTTGTISKHTPLVKAFGSLESLFTWDGIMVRGYGKVPFGRKVFCPNSTTNYEFLCKHSTLREAGPVGFSLIIIQKPATIGQGPLGLAESIFMTHNSCIPVPQKTHHWARVLRTLVNIYAVRITFCCMVGFPSVVIL